jgi:hypothetical protein
MKKEFSITLYSTQTVSTLVTVEAETEDEAVDMVMEMNASDIEWTTIGSIDPSFEIVDIDGEPAF